MTNDCLNQKLPSLVDRQGTQNENVRPGTTKTIIPFAFDPFEGMGKRYFGGPIIDTSNREWKNTFYTRSNGSVPGFKELGNPSPLNFERIVRSVAALQDESQQTALWIGPRHLISALHFQNFKSAPPYQYELDGFIGTGSNLEVESDISTVLLSDLSAKVILIAADGKNDLGLFELLPQFPPSKDWVELDWLMDRNEVKDSYFPGGRVACVGFSSSLELADINAVRQGAQDQLMAKCGSSAIANDQFDLSNITKPGFRSVAPGNFDFAHATEGGIYYGVSASLWKGSGGGPCILLDGPNAGKIIGLVRGFETLVAPYNLVNGFPSDMKQVIKDTIERRQEARSE